MTYVWSITISERYAVYLQYWFTEHESNLYDRFAPISEIARYGQVDILPLVMTPALIHVNYFRIPPI